MPKAQILIQEHNYQRGGSTVRSRGDAGGRLKETIRLPAAAGATKRKESGRVGQEKRMTDPDARDRRGGLLMQLYSRPHRRGAGDKPVES